MRHALPALLLVGLLSACVHAPVRIASTALPSGEPSAPEQYVITAVENDTADFVASAGSTPRAYATGTSYRARFAARATLQAVASDYGLREVSSWPIAPLRLHCALLQLPPGRDRDAVLAALARDPRVRLAQPLQEFTTRSAYNDPYVGLQRGFQQMDIASAHLWSRGDGVRVAIVDTGADIAHPDLAPAIERAVNFVDHDAERFGRDRHGTEIAGVIGAVANNGLGIVGIAPNARLLVLKACWQLQIDADAARCNSFTLAQALSAALDAHVQIVNLSLAGPQDPLLSKLIEEGLHRGILFVGAAGASLDSAHGLAQQAGVIAVASADDAPSRTAAVYAPSREILTLLPGDRYDFASGESIATAQVTGVIALLLARDRSLTPATALRVLESTSSAEGASGSEINACEAMRAILRQGPCAPVAAQGAAPVTIAAPRASPIALH